MSAETLPPIAESKDNLSPLDRKRPRIYMVLLLFQMLSLISNVIIVPASEDANTMISFHAANLINVFLALLLTGATINFLYYFIKRKIFFWLSAVLFFVSIALSFVSAVLKLNEHDFELYRIVYGTASF